MGEESIDLRTAGQRDPRSDRKRWTATRYLCAAAHLDPVFRESVIEDVLDQEFRAVAPSYSIDIVPIVRHCLAARRRALIGNAVITAIVAFALVVAFWSIVAVLSLLYAFVSAVRSLGAFGRRDFVSTLGYGLLAFVLLLVGVAASRSTGVETSALDAAGDATGSAKTAFGVLVLVVLGTVLATTVQLVQRHQFVLDHLIEPRFDPADAPPAPARHRERLDYLSRAQRGNVTVYAETVLALPFVGAGTIPESGRWSMALPLVPRDQETEPRPLEERQFNELMRVALASLFSRNLPEGRRLDGMSVQDRLFVRGLLPQNHELVDVTRRPVHTVSLDDMFRLAEQERNLAARYLTVRISGWAGELEVTVMLYVSIRGDMLYLEFVSAVLPPIRTFYHSVDSYETVGPGVIGRSLLAAATTTPRVLASAPLELVKPVLDDLRKALDVRARVQEITSRYAFDFGASGSVRGFGADWRTQNLLHDLDANRYITIIERKVIGAVRDVLVDHGYSTDEFDQRSTTIIDNSDNSSVVMGDLNVRDAQVAFGRGARVRGQNGASAKAPAARRPSSAPSGH